MSTPAGGRFSGGAAADYLSGVFGGILRATEAQVSVGVAAVELVRGDPERVSLTFVNLSINDVYLSTDANPSASKGVQIRPSGGTISFSCLEDGILPSLAWYALASGAASTVHVLAVLRETTR